MEKNKKTRTAKRKAKIGKVDRDKKFSVKICPKCQTRDVGVVIGGVVGMWECHKCKFTGPEFPELELSEEEFINYLDKEDQESDKEEKGRE